MNRKARLSYCNTCNNKSFNSKYGIVCGLTNEIPEFENECPDYDKNVALEQEYKSKNFDSISILDDLYLKRNLTLSSGWTKRAFVFSIIMPFVFLAIFTFIGVRSEFSPVILIMSGFSGLLLIILPIVYSRLTIAEINGDSLRLKRIFGKEKEVQFSAIQDVSSFRISRTTFVTVKIKNKSTEPEKYTIMNSKSLLSFENRNAKKILLALKDYDSLKRFV